MFINFPKGHVTKERKEGSVREKGREDEKEGEREKARKKERDQVRQGDCIVMKIGPGAYFRLGEIINSGPEF